MNVAPALAQMSVGRRGRATQGHERVDRLTCGSPSPCCRDGRTPSRGRVLAADGDAATFYAGAADIALYRTETGRYRDNLASGAPSLWVALRPTGNEPPYDVVAVTADPAEGESFTQAGDDLVGAVPMPAPVRDMLEAFIAEHHVEQLFVKRKRDRAEPRPPSRPRGREETDRAKPIGGRGSMNDPESFLSRWSRRKRETSQEAAAADPPAATDAPAQDDRTSGEISTDPAPAAVGSRIRSGKPAVDRIDHRGDRHPRIPRRRRAGGFDACGASPRLVVRSRDPRFRRAVGEFVGLQRAGRYARIWSDRPLPTVARLVAQAIGKPEAAPSGQQSRRPRKRIDSQAE